MKRFLSKRFGFFAAAAVICWATMPFMESDLVWVSFAAGCLYAVLSGLFLLEELSRQR